MVTIYCKSAVILIDSLLIRGKLECGILSKEDKLHSFLLHIFTEEKQIRGKNFRKGKQHFIGPIDTFYTVL